MHMLVEIIQDLYYLLLTWYNILYRASSTLSLPSLLEYIQYQKVTLNYLCSKMSFHPHKVTVAKNFGIASSYLNLMYVVPSFLDYHGKILHVLGTCHSNPNVFVCIVKGLNLQLWSLYKYLLAYFIQPVRERFRNVARQRGIIFIIAVIITVIYQSWLSFCV